MVEHIVLLKLKSNASEEQIRELTQALLKMGDEIPGIEEISAGANSSSEGKNQGYDYGMIVRFRDAGARDNYLPHPFHLKTSGEHLRPMADDVLVLDYEH